MGDISGPCSGSVGWGDLILPVSYHPLPMLQWPSAPSQNIFHKFMSMYKLISFHTCQFILTTETINYSLNFVVSL